MYEPPPGYEIVFSTGQRDECMESRLVLEAVGISADAVHRDGSWFLVVDGDDLSTSASELEAYRLENRDRSSRNSTTATVYGGAGLAVLVYAGTISIVGILTAPWAFRLQGLAAGRVQAGKVMAGEWWRTVTALTLHLDTGHIVGNLAFGALFGFLAGQGLGGGVAWMTILAAGAMGNLINAMFQAPTHSSVGASTAVFAALGVLVAHSLPPWATVQEKPLRRWSPLIGGVLLLAFIGVGGERTDQGAHLSGFLAGMTFGWVACRLPKSWLASSRVQTWTGFATIAIVAFAWFVGLAMAASSDTR